MLKHKLFLCIAVLVIACTSSLGQAQQPFHLSESARFSFGMEWGNLWLWGETLIPAGGQIGSGSKLDAQSDLGIDQSESTGLFLTMSLYDAHLFAVDFMAYAPSGSRTLTRKIRFHNQTYNEGTSIDTKLDFNWSRFNYAYKLIDYSQFWIAPKIGVHHIRNTTTINGVSVEEGLISNTRSLDGTYPVLGFDTKFLFPLGLDVGLELEGIHLISRGYLGLVRLAAKWEFHPEVAFIASTSFRAVQYLEDYQPLNNEWTYSLLGWSAGISFSF
jgi:hypothetical protein